jgi:diaminopimelate decarboxylase
MVVELHRRTGFAPRILDIGGGWPRARDPESRCLELNPLPIEEYASTTCTALLEALEAGSLPVPELWLEPGRYIVGNAGVLLTTVGTVKRDLGFTWVNLDASSNNLPRMDTSGSVYWVLPAAGLERAMSEAVTFVGGTCTDSIFGIDRVSPPVKRGDIFAILDAGMYAESASTQFNSMPRPATVLVNGASADLIKERETVADLFAHSRIPERLRSG